MLGAYTVLTGAMITLGRVGFGLEQSLSSRYTTFSLCLVVALIYLAAISLEHYSGDNRLAGFKKWALPAVVVLACSQTLVYAIGVRQMSAQRVMLLQGKACLLFVNVVPQEKCLAGKVYDIDYAVLAERANRLDELGFLRPRLIKSDVAENIERAVEPGRNIGSFEGLTKSNDDVYVASGWAVLADRDERADAILLADQQEDGKAVVFALADSGVETGLLDKLLKTDWPLRHARWEKTFSFDKIPASPVIISAWSFDAQRGEAYKLPGTHVIQ